MNSRGGGKKGGNEVEEGRGLDGEKENRGGGFEGCLVLSGGYI